MKRTFLLLAFLSMLSLISCKKSSLSTTKNEQEKQSASLSTGIPQLIPLWSKIADNPHFRSHAFGFAIGTTGYVGGGWGLDLPYASYGSFRDFWQYDPSTNVWTRKADLPGYTTEHTASFVIGNKGYISTGHHSYTGPDSSLFDRYLKDTWEYDPAIDQWTKKADFPGGERGGAVGISINGKGYVGLGRGPFHFWGGPTIEVSFSDWWEYDPVIDKWTRKKSFPGTARENAAGCAVGSFGYVGTGYTSSDNYLNDWWQYDPATDNWVQKANLPGVGRRAAVAFTSMDLTSPKACIATGFNSNIPNFSDQWLRDLWRYNPATNQWAQSINMPYGRFEAACFTVNNTVYIGSGGDYWVGIPEGGVETKDFWAFHL
jgi:N-acetylneuraminic acid mutarotase